MITIKISIAHKETNKYSRLVAYPTNLSVPQFSKFFLFKKVFVINLN